jgi:hypothetical protein
MDVGYVSALNKLQRRDGRKYIHQWTLYRSYINECRTLSSLNRFEAQTSPMKMNSECIPQMGRHAEKPVWLQEGNQLLCAPFLEELDHQS